MADVAECYETEALRLSEWIESPSGPVCRAFVRFEESARALPLGVRHASLSTLKSYLENEVARVLGSLPQWAEEWVKERGFAEK